MKRSDITKLVIFIDVQLAILLGLVFYDGISNKIEPSQNSEDVLGAEYIPENQEYTVSVCNVENCVYLSSNDVMKDGAVDKNLVYQAVLENVFPYFENTYGGKGYASNSGGSFVYWKEDVRPDLTNVFDEVYRSFKSGLDTNVEVSLKDMASTDGKYAEKYIEVDNSRQKLFVWNAGVVEKEILLSGPKDGYEVFGVFPIVDKGLNPKAPTGDYMPYWMAFYYSSSQDSWYGLHSLIWWYDANGRAVYEPESNIGVRRSGGCIRMVEEDAKYLYDNFQKGDLILIHE